MTTPSASSGQAPSASSGQAPSASSGQVLAGLEVRPSEDMTRIRAVCEHQRGLIYVVPAERSWVCSPESMPAHALAGFFRELVALKHPGVEDLMKQWGLYYRQLPAPSEE